MNNTQALLINDCQTELSKANYFRKYQHQINYDVTIGLIKHQLVALFVEQEPAAIYQQPRGGRYRRAI
ncbi:MAG: hypothetical protein AAF944_00925 [Bacteroidota bacterium]